MPLRKSASQISSSSLSFRKDFAPKAHRSGAQHRVRRTLLRTALKARGGWQAQLVSEAG